MSAYPPPTLNNGVLNQIYNSLDYNSTSPKFLKLSGGTISGNVTVSGDISTTDVESSGTVTTSTLNTTNLSVSSQNVALGSGSSATGSASLALMKNSTASATNSIAIGQGATASHSGGVAIGLSAATSANNQVVLGTSATTVVLAGTGERNTAVGGFRMGALNSGGNGFVNIKSTNTYASGNNASCVSLQNGEGNRYITFHYNANGAEIGSIYQVSGSQIGYSTSSDRRLKRNICDFSANEIISKLTPQKYTFVDDAENHFCYGFMGQEVHSVLPSVCNLDTDLMANDDLENPLKDDGSPLYYSLDYSKLTPILWKALQEQQIQINNLNQEVESLL